jgi:hypothetical protein
VSDHATVHAAIRAMPPLPVWRTLAPEAEARQDGDAITFTWPDLAIRIVRLPDEQLATHLTALVADLRRRGAGEGLAIRALGTMSVFEVAVEPGLDEGGRAIDVIASLTGATDGFCVIGEQILENGGRDLLADPALPDAARVARRALVLVAGAFRGLLEDDAGKPDQPRAEALRGELAGWLRATPAAAEADDEELAFVETPIGEGFRDEIVQRVWAAEGAQLLLWALGARPLPAFDHSEHPYAIARAIGLLGDGPPALLAAPALRPAAELEAQRRRLLGIHWRLVEQRVNPGRVDFRGFARTAWFGGFDLADLPLADDDLAIGGVPLWQAPPPALRLASSIAIERHRAANWLAGAHPRFWRVATPT